MSQARRFWARAAPQVNARPLPRRNERRAAGGRPAAGRRRGRNLRQRRLVGLRPPRLRPRKLFPPPVPQPGREEIELIWSGLAWRFATAANRHAFELDPEVYAPRIGGYDASAAAEGRLVAAEPTRFAIRDDRLYLFREDRSRARFLRDPSLAEKAKARWPDLKRDLVRN